MTASLVDRTVDRALEPRRSAIASEIRRLVEAALALIQRTGTVEPTVGDIVREAGLSNKAFYKHFRSKHQLLVAVLDEGIRILASYLSHRMQSAATPEARVREWIRGMLEQALDREGAEATRPFALARGRLAETFPEEVAHSEKQITALLRAAIADGVASGAMPQADPDGDSEALYHLTMGWLEARLLESGVHGAPLRAGLSGRAAGSPSDAHEQARDDHNRRDAVRLEAFALGGLLRAAAEAPAATGD